MLIVFLEVIFMILLLYYMITYVLEFFTKWKGYSKWINSEIPYFSDLELFQRREKCPEVLRQLRYIFSMLRIVDLFFFTFSIVAFINWVIYTTKTCKYCRDLDGEFPSDYTNEIKDSYESLCSYINYTSLALLILAIKSIEYRQHSGAMEMLTTTLSYALEDLFYIFVILVILLIGFSGISNIAFSQTVDTFKSIGRSFVSYILLLMGK
jgi:hypothetical protein